MKKDRERRKKHREYADAQAQAQQRDSGFVPACLKLPESTNLLSFRKEGIFRWDVIPYQVKYGKRDRGGNPFQEAGKLAPERTYYAHKGIGVDEGTYACLRKNWGVACPVCDRQAEIRRNPAHDEKVAKALAPKDRQLWNILDLNEPDKGIQVFEGSYYFGLGQLIDAKCKSADDEDDYRNYFHLEDGLTLKISVEKTAFTEGDRSGNFNKPVNLEMRPRKKQYDEDVLEQAVCLDDCIIPAAPKQLRKKHWSDYTDEDWQECYDELQRILDATGSKGKKKADKKKAKPEEDDEDDDDDLEDEEEEEAPRRRKSAKAAEKDDEDDDLEDEEEDEDEDLPDYQVGDTVSFKYKGKKLKGEVTKVNTRKELYEIEVEDRDKPCVLDWSDDTLKLLSRGTEEDDDEEDEKPAKKAKGKKKPSRDEEDEEEDEDEDEWEDEEDEPKAKKARKRARDDEDDWEDESPDDEDEDEKPRKKKRR